MHHVRVRLVGVVILCTWAVTERIVVLLLVGVAVFKMLVMTMRLMILVNKESGLIHVLC